MRFRELDTVVLERDVPAHGLKRRDLGAVVEVYQPNSVEVEFVTASGKTKALVILNVADIRPRRREDLVALARARAMHDFSAMAVPSTDPLPGDAATQEGARASPCGLHSGR